MDNQKPDRDPPDLSHVSDWDDFDHPQAEVDDNYGQPLPSQQELAPSPPQGLSPMTPQVIEEGKMWAALSYVSVFTLIPLFLIPLFQKNNSFALVHARQAAVAYAAHLVAYVFLAAVSAITCGVALPAMGLLPILSLGVTIVGGLKAAEGSVAPLPLLTPWSEKVFGPTDTQLLPPQ